MRLYIYVLLILCSFHQVQPTKLSSVPNVHLSRSTISDYSRHKIWRGGMSSFPEGTNELVKVFISTRYGSKFLDKSVVLSLRRSDTVADIKKEIFRKFPGKPPIELQCLFHGTKKLLDEVPIGEITNIAALPIQLDMVTGTSSYERPMHTAEMVEAYSAMCAQQGYISNKMTELMSSPRHITESSSDGRGELGDDQAAHLPESLTYAHIFSAMNASLYDNLGEFIQAASSADSDAEAPSAGALSSSMKHAADGLNSPEEWVAARPRDAALAKLLDLNVGAARGLLIYSVMCAVYGLFGVTTMSGRLFFLGGAPALWILKLRPFRFAVKLGRNFLLAMLQDHGFLRAMLPTPLQTISIHSAEWLSSVSGDSIQRAVDIMHAWFAKLKRMLGVFGMEGEVDLSELLVDRMNSVDGEVRSRVGGERKRKKRVSMLHSRGWQHNK